MGCCCWMVLGSAFVFVGVVWLWATDNIVERAVSRLGDGLIIFDDIV